MKIDFVNGLVLFFIIMFAVSFGVMMADEKQKRDIKRMEEEQRLKELERLQQTGNGGGTTTGTAS